MLHFTNTEFADRKARCLAAMRSEGLDALLLFRQESMYWLTGYDTFGYCFFQCLVLTAEGDLVLLTRSADLRQAQLTSIIQDVRIWVDRDGANPARDLRSILEEKGLAGRRLGVEWETHGLTAANGKRLACAMDGFVSLTDASLLVSRLRLVKSAAELVYVERAAALADDALDAAERTAAPGVDEGTILARMHDAVFEGGGDYPGNPFIIGSGPQALLCRYASGRRKLDSVDQLTLEFAGIYRQYHVCQMHTLIVGQPRDEQRAAFEAAAEALLACEDLLRPGRTMGEVYEAHATTLDRKGMGRHRLNACGYSLGAVYAPSWMDWPMFYANNPALIEPGMVFFLHMIIMNSEKGLATTLGRTSIVGETGPRTLSRRPLTMICR